MSERIAIYIASPYTPGDQAENVRRSLDVANWLWDNGFLPFCPLLSHFWHFLTPKPWGEWSTMMKMWVERCDAVLRLEGESDGADIEVEFALELGIPVFYDVNELANYYVQV